MESHKFVVDVNGYKKIVGDCTSIEACNAVRRLMSVDYCAGCGQAKETSIIFNNDCSYFSVCAECR